MKNNLLKITLFSFIVFLVGGVFMMNYLQTALHTTTMTLGVDLYPRWVGAEAVLEGKSPYSFETRQMIWQAVYGSSETPTGNPFGFYYPPSITTLFSPLILAGVSLEDAAVAWCALIWALWSVSFLLWMIAIEIPQKARLAVLPLVLISGIFFRPAYSNYLLGQYSLFSILMLVSAWFSLKNKNFILAGILGALSLIKFSLTILPFTFLLILCYRNWKFILSIVITSFILYLPPTLILGWWIPDFINDISRYALENEVAWSWIDAITASGIVWLLISLALLIRGLRFGDFDLAIAAALTLNAIFVPHTADYDLVVFIPILLLLGNRLFANGKISPWLSLSVFGFMIWFPWASLIYFISQPVQAAVESWYRFIWLVYPSIILIPVFFYETLMNSRQPTLHLNNQGQS